MKHGLPEMLPETFLLPFWTTAKPSTRVFFIVREAFLSWYLELDQA